MGGVGSSFVGLSTWKAFPGTTGKGPVDVVVAAVWGGGGLFFCFVGAGVFPSSPGFSLAFAGVLAGLSLFCGRRALALSRMVVVSRSPK